MLQSRNIQGLCLALLCLFVGSNAEYVGLFGTKYSKQIEDHLSKMTTYEKIGQLIQPNRGTINDTNIGQVTVLRAGSVLSAGGEGPSYPNQDFTKNSPADWLAMVKRYTSQYVNYESKTPIWYAVDAVHGHNSVTGTTIFPHNIGMGCANDTDLAYRQGKVTASELRGTGISETFAPFVSVPGDLRWGRTYEGYSQVTADCGRNGAAFIKGAQSPISGYDPRPLSACTSKHFVADGQWVWGTGVDPSTPELGMATNRTNATSFIIDEGEFDVTDSQIATGVGLAHKAAIDAGVMTVMISYGRSKPDDLSNIINPAIITDLLRNKYGFKGVIISDYEDPARVFPPIPLKEATLRAFKAGLDIVMLAATTFESHQYIVDLVNEGRLTIDEVNEKVRHVLEVKFHLGLFDHPIVDDFANYPFFSEANQAVATEAVEKSLVLLQNKKNALPVNAGATKSIGLFGWASANIGVICGGWTLTWQAGNWTQNELPGYNILQGINSYISTTQFKPTVNFVNTTNNTAFVPGGPYDVGVYVAAENPLATYAEGYGDQSRPSLNPIDIRNIQIAKKAVGKLIVIIISGRPVEIDPVVLKTADAIVAAWLPGNLGGKGIANALFGKSKFTGKLHYDWPKTYLGYNGQKYLKRPDILYPYGYGLSTGKY